MNEKAAGTLGCLFQIVYFGMGLLQLAAIIGGIEDWWGWPWWLAILIAFPVAYIPILGTVVGIMGAVESFGWSVGTSIALFCWPYILYIALIALGGASDLFARFRNRE